jgi:hypothetical protein
MGAELNTPALPQPVLQYLATNDSLVRAQLSADHPDLPALLASSQTLAELRRWLGSDGAWAAESAQIVISGIELLRPELAAGDEQIIRSFLLHPEAQVRLQAYEFLLTIYFPDCNRQAMFILLHGMLTDQSDQVRSAAALYIERVNAVGELRDFLVRWRKSAIGLGWAGGESYELVERLLDQGQP